MSVRSSFAYTFLSFSYQFGKAFFCDISNIFVYKVVASLKAVVTAAEMDSAMTLASSDTSTAAIYFVILLASLISLPFTSLDTRISFNPSSTFSSTISSIFNEGKDGMLVQYKNVCLVVC